LRPCIIAVHQTPYALSRPEVSLEEMIYQSVQELLSQSGLSIRDVDHLAVASSDGLDGRPISSMVTMAPAGGYDKDYINSSSSGEHALIMACLRVLGGRSRISLVANWAKPSEAPLAAVERLQLEPFFHRRLQLDRTDFLALQASCYVQRYQVAPQVAAGIVVKNRKGARVNPFGLQQEEVTVNDVLASPIVAWPLRELDLPVSVDGAVALLVATEDVARASGHPYAVVEGLGWNTDSYWIGDRAISEIPSLVRAAHQAYRQADIRDPLAQLDVIELSDLTPYHELMAYEALGLCGRGEGAAMALSGELDRAGKLPVNPSGGLQAAYPEFAAGLDRVVSVFRQVTGIAGDGQIPGARRGLAHAAAGFAAQANSVFILEGREAHA
jgi:acetyl-CoA C-acetyltransferase